MAARSTMAALITRLRTLVADPAGGSQVWADDDLQLALDAHRHQARYAELAPLDSVAPGGAITWLVWVARETDWEDSPELVNSAYTVITPASSDLIRGRWTFASHQAAGVLITGDAFNVYAAAADVLDMWAAKVAREFDFTTDNATFRRSQQAAALRAQAEAYRTRAGQWGQGPDDVGAGAYGIEVYA